MYCLKHLEAPPDAFEREHSRQVPRDCRIDGIRNMFAFHE